LKIDAKRILDDVNTGDSLSVDGICLTITEVHAGSVAVEASEHTVAESTIGNWQVGRRVNLERAVKVGDRLGGHIVQGHIDGLGRVTRVRFGEGSSDIYIDLDGRLLKLVAPKGSIAVNGVSLTIAEKMSRGFKLMVVPYALEHTTLGELKPGDEVNIETDIIIRWLADRFPEGEIVDTPFEGWQQTGEFHLED
jgi:riboflavin synthase